MIFHKAAFIEEIVNIIRNKDKKDIIVDGTSGTGSHSLALLENFWRQIKHLFCIDIDNEILDITRQRVEEFIRKLSGQGPTIHFIRDNYKNLDSYLLNNKADIIILDLGVSQYHLKTPQRGFGFDSPCVDMRYDKSTGAPAFDEIKNLSEEKLSKILTAYGDIKRPLRIVKILKEYINLNEKRVSLGDYLRSKLPKVRGRLHPATLIFQALRIYVNKELDNLESFLGIVPKVLATGGLLFVITYHSIEDRIVKIYFKNYVKFGKFSLYNKKVIKPSYEEIVGNKPIRSAKLRILYRGKEKK